MAAGDTHVADPVDIVHHEMYSAVCNESQICMVTSNRRTTRPREGGCRPIHTMNLQYVVVMKDFQIFGCILCEIYS